MVRSGLTEKRMRDKRFRQAEDAILNVFFSINECLNVNDFIKRAQISRSTFYRHHRDVWNIVSDYEKYLLKKYTKLMQSWRMNYKLNLELLFEKMLIFVLANRKAIIFLFKNGNKELIKEMIKMFELRIISELKISKVVFMVYYNEILGVIEEWYERGFEEADLKRTLNNIMYLTQSVKKRLMGLKD